MKGGFRNRIGISMFFCIFSFLNFVITAFIVAGISYLAFHNGLINKPGKFSYFFVTFTVLITCIIVGTIVSLLLGSIPMEMMRKIITSINRLANGDFSTRLMISYPPEFRELADSFNRMAEELGGIELLRKDFINNFSHEFKTPIVSVRGFAQMLKYADLTPEEREEYLDIVISESDRLTSLATNVLNLSKVENQIILADKTSFNLGEQVRRCILMLESRWEQKKLSFSADIQDIQFMGNEEMLSQVWLNLIDNAVKFTPWGGSINVTLGFENKKVKFFIYNSGEGISADAVPRIFDRFYQADKSHSTEGNGLGLTMTDKIVRLHDGTIKCKSTPGEGTIFIVMLPLKPGL